MLEVIKDAANELLTKFDIGNYKLATDRLTGLPIVPSYYNQLHKYLKRQQKNVGVICLDIVNFSQIEEQYGYRMCEKILISITDILQDISNNLLRSQDKIGISNRGGDDFIIFLADLEDQIQQAEKSLGIIANRIKSETENRLNELNYIDQKLQLYFGYTVIDAKEVNRVESAIYKAIKKVNKQAKDKKYQEWLKSKRTLEEIINREQIKIVFQPIISLQTGKKIGYEALTRGPEKSELENPERLFSLAKQTDMLLELERLCRKKSLIKAEPFIEDEKLFINVSPEVMKSDDFQKGVTQQVISDLGIEKEDIVFEVTEKTAISNFKLFRKILNHYYEQGYQVTIDDVGAGYANLQTISELCPRCIKLDMSLIKEINFRATKESLIEALISFAHRIDAKVIAEGIETYDELEKLIELGVDYGQGYLIQHPQPTDQPIGAKLKRFINWKNEELENKFTIDSLEIKNIARAEATLQQDDLVEKAVEYFEQDRHLKGIVVLNKHHQPLGLLMKDELYYKLGKRFGVSLFMERPVELIMDKNPLIVDAEETLEEVSRKAMSREHEKVYNYIIVSKDNQYYGTVSIQRLLEKITKLQLDVAQNLNPLTGLPGNSLIQQRLDRMLGGNLKLAIMYIDLDNFKKFNDQYGFECGDRVIELVAEILIDISNKEDFVGHIGGDDFIVMTELSEVEQIAKKIIEQYESKVKELIVDKELEEPEQPTVSIAVVTTAEYELDDSFAVGKVAAQLKDEVKKLEGSNYLING
ncbi:MAG: EAL domain-containing protein [Bacillota bacterium]